MKQGKYKVISVFSCSEEEFDSNHSRNFFLLDREKVNCNSVEAFANYVKADLSALAFRQRLIPKVQELVTIPIGTKSSSTEIISHNGKLSTEAIEILETKPDNTKFDAIITDFMLERYANRVSYKKNELYPHGLGIVAWAVMHSIPVRLIYEDARRERQQNFWIESVLDTLQSHPCCKGGKIITGHSIDVCRDMYHLLKEL